MPRRILLGVDIRHLARLGVTVRYATQLLDLICADGIAIEVTPFQAPTGCATPLAILGEIKHGGRVVAAGLALGASDVPLP